MTHEEAALGCLGEFALFNPHSSPAREVGSQMGIRYGLTCPGPELECPGVPAGLRWVGASAYQEPECSQRSIPELQHRGIHHWTPNRCGPGATERRLWLWVHRWLGAPCRRPMFRAEGQAQTGLLGAQAPPVLPAHILSSGRCVTPVHILW